jgi:MFS family permease
VTLGAPVFPLAVLFGPKAADELDRTAFAVLLPEIRDHFGLIDAGALALVAVGTIAVLFAEVPLSFYCDRHNRVRIATTGAAMHRPEFLLRVVAIVGVVGGFLLVRARLHPTRSVAIGGHALVSLVAPPRVRAAAFSTMSVFAIPGIAVFLPLIGAVSDAVGIQASMALMVPVSLAAGFVLASARSFVRGDVETVRRESLALATAATKSRDTEPRPETPDDAQVRTEPD